MATEGGNTTFRQTARGRRLYRYTVDLFISMLRDIKGASRFEYRMTDADVAGFDSWVQYWGADKVGEEFARQWAEYGFQSWFNAGAARDYNHAVRYNWIFNGKSAVARWKALDATVRTRVVRTSLKQRYKITPRNHSSVTSSARTALYTTVRPAEEALKKRFYGTPRGALWCIANTSLYNHRSSLCVVCAFKDDCALTLKREFPLIALARGYVTEKELKSEHGKQEGK